MNEHQHHVVGNSSKTLRSGNFGHKVSRLSLLLVCNN